jgi:hypothetical protein
LKERAERGKVKEDRFDEHEAIFLNTAQTWIRLVETCWRKFLILGQDQVLATNNGAQRLRAATFKVGGQMGGRFARSLLVNY